MRIAVTADVHLVPGDEHPERLAALADLLGQLPALDIDRLIIAGDLFHRDRKGYAEFEGLCREHRDVAIHVIPGNHDPSLEPGHIVADNVTVHDRPEIVKLDGVQVLFVPYREGSRMGEVVAEQADGLSSGEWVLVGHGDYYGGLRQPNPLEKGIYMPLSRRDLQQFSPRTVLLGHIHVAGERDIVHYPGSPCGLGISETGRRQFLVFDTQNHAISGHTIASDVLYFWERFVVVPADDEARVLADQAAERIAGWQLSPEELSRAQVRVEAAGYCNDRQAIETALREAFAEVNWHDDGPLLEDLEISVHPQLQALAARVEQRIAQLSWTWGGGDPERNDVLAAALGVLYGRETDT